MNTSAIHNTASHTFSAINFTSNSTAPKALKYDKRNGVLNIASGTQKPLAVETYLKADQVVKYHFKAKDELHLHISLIKYNASSIKGLFNIFNSLNQEYRQGKNVSVSWITPWDDEDVFDLAYDFSERYNFNIDIIPG